MYAFNGSFLISLINTAESADTVQIFSEEAAESILNVKTGLSFSDLRVSAFSSNVLLFLKALPGLVFTCFIVTDLFLYVVSEISCVFLLRLIPRNEFEFEESFEKFHHKGKNKDKHFSKETKKIRREQRKQKQERWETD